MAEIIGLLLVAAVCGFIVQTVLKGDVMTLGEPAPPRPEPTRAEPRAVTPTDEPAETAEDAPPARQEVARPEPTGPEAADVFVLEALAEPLPEIDAAPARSHPGRGARRRPRFEDVADLTTPTAYLLDPGAQAATVQHASIPDKVPVHIPIATRLFGAVRLMLLVAVSAAAVALAVIGAGYVLIDRVIGGL